MITINGVAMGGARDHASEVSTWRSQTSCLLNLQNPHSLSNRGGWQKSKRATTIIRKVSELFDDSDIDGI